jgi:hypothetical protein
MNASTWLHHSGSSGLAGGFASGFFIRPKISWWVFDRRVQSIFRSKIASAAARSPGRPIHSRRLKTEPYSLWAIVFASPKLSALTKSVTQGLPVLSLIWKKNFIMRIECCLISWGFRVIQRVDIKKPLPPQLRRGGHEGLQTASVSPEWLIRLDRPRGGGRQPTRHAKAAHSQQL